MHPRQANLLTHAIRTVEQISGKPSERPKTAAQAFLWKYTDPDGGVFYLEERVLTIKSPYSGKTFTARPTKHTPSQVGKDLREDGGDKTASVDPWKVRMPADSIHAIWVDPLTFDGQTNGPPYLPEKGQMKEAHESFGGVFSGLVQRFEGVPMSELGALLAILRAASHVHQSHHWQTRGGHFYGDHLLFMRIYEDSQTFIDQVAERAVGSGHAVLVSPSLQISSMGFLIQLWCGTPGVLGAEGMVEASLNVERCVVHCIGEARKSLEARGELSDGTDNLIQGAADKHEEFLYLLQQRGGKLEYSYDRTGL